MFYLAGAEAETGEAIEEQIQNLITSEPVAPHTASVAKGGGFLGDVSFGFVAFWTLIGILIVIGLRKQFVLRRLLIMIPTLIIISFVVFFIIQLPPGSFIETKILALEELGDRDAIEQVEQLRDSFWIDEPWLERYARWSGLYWFTSFDSVDKGLLQGNFGRSMETLTDVNAMVDERLLLTVAVSAGTILFTWAVAFPIGVISAVRQYTFADYFFTVIGFLGMCIPNFLLALLLSYWGSRFFGADLTGLFSQEYIGQPNWTWGKFVDLLKHLWIPIVVIGVSGTLGMIRVVRNNLLDELKKPYVVTARAKGVRPLRLLIKYPVRMALNPFVSSIGGIFPALVSGGAIVAIVLSLPTVGPLLLTALMTEDFYLAASLLMVLSTLSVIGVLFSDVLLMILDPRIRMEKGSK
jgi:ABC-type dipeptide/oligopeptide/nickel transport system permease component